MFLFDLNEIFFTVLNYPVSYLELIGTLSGLACVYLTAKEKVLCWPVGIVNLIFFFILFYQVRLYSDMLLQVFFFIMTLYGWWKWTHPKTEKDANKNKELKISRLSAQSFTLITGISLGLTAALGAFMARVHLLIPQWFSKPADFPYADAATTVFSITANLLMTVKKLECWLLWVAVDIFCVALYAVKGIYLMAAEYLIFGAIAFFGYLNWRREHRSYAPALETEA